MWRKLRHQTEFHLPPHGPVVFAATVPGDVEGFGREFEADLAVIDLARAAFGLPPDLKLSVHSGSDKFSIYGPIACAIKKQDAAEAAGNVEARRHEPAAADMREGFGHLRPAGPEFDHCEIRRTAHVPPKRSHELRHQPPEDGLHLFGGVEVARAAEREKTQCQIQNNYIEFFSENQ